MFKGVDVNQFASDYVKGFMLREQEKEKGIYEKLVLKAPDSFLLNLKLTLEEKEEVMKEIASNIELDMFILKAKAYEEGFLEALGRLKTD